MSRLGKVPLPVPKGVNVSVVGELLKAKGPLGELAVTMDPAAPVKIDSDGVLVTRNGGYWFLGFVDLFIVLGLFEFYRMMSVKGMHPYRGVGIASGLTLSTYMYFRSGMYASFFSPLY